MPIGPGPQKKQYCVVLPNYPPYIQTINKMIRKNEVSKLAETHHPDHSSVTQKGPVG